MAEAAKPRPHRLRRIVLWVLGLGLGVPLGLVVLALAILFVGANTGPGRRLIESQADSLTGGTVRLTGLAGRFPDALRLGHLELRDARGPWLTIDDLVLDWAPTRLIGGTLRVDALTARRIDVIRMAESSAAPEKPKAAGSSGGGINIGVDLARLDIAQLHLGPALLGAPGAPVDAPVGAPVGAPVLPNGALLGISGHARLASLKPILAGVSIATLPDADIALQVVRQDAPGSIALAAQVARDRLGVHLGLTDPANGLAAQLGHLPALDPLGLKLDLDGPRSAAVLALALQAGTAPKQLQAHADGTVDLEHLAGTVHLTAQAPDMALAPGVSWRSVALDLTTRGAFARPNVNGTLDLADLAAGGARIGHLAARVTSQAQGQSVAGPVSLAATLTGLTIPGPKPGLLSAAPLQIEATAQMAQAARPVTLALTHPLLHLTAKADTLPKVSGTAHLDLPDLAPLAQAGNVALDGHAAIDARFDLASSPQGSRNALGLDGHLALTGGLPAAVGLVGPDGHLVLDAVQTTPAGADPPQTIALNRLALDGQAVHLEAHGTDAASVLDMAAHVALPKLEAAVPSLRGGITADVTATGPMTDLAATVRAQGDPGTATMPRGPITLALDAHHLPNAPQATLRLDGMLDRAKLALAAAVQRAAGGATHITLDTLDWKSASGRADMTLAPGAALPLGRFDLKMTRLADLAPVVGQPVTGSLTAALRTTQNGGKPRATLDVQARDAGLPSARVGRLSLTGFVDDPTGARSVDLTLKAAGIAAGAVAGNAQVTARGPQTALAVAAKAQMQNVAGGPANLDTALVLDLPQTNVTLRSLRADAKGEALRLLAPAKVTFGKAVAVDRLRVSLAPASGGGAPALLDVAGKVSPALDLTASLSNVTPALARPFAPTLDATGVIAAQARLTGTTARPGGTIRVTAQNLHMRTGPAASVPAANLQASAELAGTLARLQAKLTAGSDVNLNVGGTAPLAAGGQIAMRADGTLDLALANPILEAQGRQVKGRIALALGIAGTAAAPRVTGTVRLSGGSVQDFAQGVRLTDIAGLIEAQGQTLRIANFIARAGDGSIGASGTVGVLAPGLPVDLHITARNARPLSSDLLTAVLDADIAATGQASGALKLGGTVTIDSASINIPNSFPSSVAQLHVIRPGDKPPAPQTSGGASNIALALVLDAPGQIFVRGHGLDAELGGRLTVGGTAAAPQVGGGFDLRHGQFSLVGTTLDFTKGRVGFNGAGVTNKIDPTLDFTAESVVNSTTARLHVGGYADAPKITLSSTPALPQDQVLALLLFGQDTKSLSPFQIAEIASALAELSGVGGGGSTLNSIRNGLGLDRLSVGGGSSGSSNNSGASVEAGKYVARGVYVGAKQATSGGGTQAQVQVDLTRHLKLDTTVGTGGTVTGQTTPENDPGSSVGLKYQFNY